jgi:hypothetical protein
VITSIGNHSPGRAPWPSPGHRPALHGAAKREGLKDMTDAKDKHIASLEQDKIRLIERCTAYENHIMKMDFHKKDEQ